jgi:hypothetical protein
MLTVPAYGCASRHKFDPLATLISRYLKFFDYVCALETPDSQPKKTLAITPAQEFRWTNTKPFSKENAAIADNVG